MDQRATATTAAAAITSIQKKTSIMDLPTSSTTTTRLTTTTRPIESHMLNQRTDSTGKISRLLTAELEFPMTANFQDATQAIQEQYQATDIYGVQPLSRNRIHLTFKSISTINKAFQEGIKFQNNILHLKNIELPSTWITIKQCPLEICDEQITELLLPFGKIESIFKQRDHLRGWFNGNRRVRIQMAKPVPNILQIGNYNIYVQYDGVQKLCKRCLSPNHLANACTVPFCHRCRTMGHRKEDCIGLETQIQNPQPQEENAEENINNPLPVTQQSPSLLGDKSWADIVTENETHNKSLEPKISNIKRRLEENKPDNSKNEVQEETELQDFLAEFPPLPITEEDQEILTTVIQESKQSKEQVSPTASKVIEEFSSDESESDSEEMEIIISPYAPVKMTKKKFEDLRYLLSDPESPRRKRILESKEEQIVKDTAMKRYIRHKIRENNALIIPDSPIKISKPTTRASKKMTKEKSQKEENNLK